MIEVFVRLPDGTWKLRLIDYERWGMDPADVEECVRRQAAEDGVIDFRVIRMPEAMRADRV